MSLSSADMSDVASRVYVDSPLFRRMIQRWRPYICPFHLLVEEMPKAARVLDVGCGSGLFLALLAHHGKLSEGYGFDSNAEAVEMANRMLHRLPPDPDVHIEYRDAAAAWPSGEFEIVSMIDVLHHVPPDEQRNVIFEAAQHVAPGGLFLYKDMVDRPLWRAWANRLHDLVLARQWIHYASLADVCRWVEEAGLKRSNENSLNMLWYGHEWVTYRRPE